MNYREEIESFLKKALPHSRDFNRELGSAYFIYRK